MDKIIFKKDPDFPPLLKEINDPPDKLHIRGNIKPLLDSSTRILCVVGARKNTNYGKQSVSNLLSGLKGYNISIVSGLALGIDSIAHRTALEAGLHTVAFPGSGLDPDFIYPPSHKGLAEEIVECGGALISEFKPTQEGAPWTFPKRNRLMAGISHATLVIEAELKSGTLITSKFATDYNRDVGAVPGDIFSPLSAGPHMLIRLGATPITSSDDLLELLGFARRENQGAKPLTENTTFRSLGEHEKKIIYVLQRGSAPKDTVVRELGLSAREANMIISSLELEGFIKEEMGTIRIT